jgi:branched-subunit amino acid aminotransferase/4-amino-4-deoxychorismate lyase
MLIDDSGTVLETSIANLWVVRDEVVSTPPAPECCLPGVMRGWLLDRLPQAGVTIEVRRVSEEETTEADEIWLSNAVIGVRRVGRLDGRRWSVWPVFDRLADLGIPAPGWP